MIDTLERQIHQIERGVRQVARHQPGCQALMGQFGVGELIALTFVAELGDASRMSGRAKRFGSPALISACTALIRPVASGG